MDQDSLILKLFLLPLLFCRSAFSQIEPCSTRACDSLVVKSILESAGADPSRNFLFPGERVTQLDLSGLGITSLPAEIGKLDSLKSLSLRRNELAELPSTMAQLTNLDVVFLDHNRFTALPPVVRNWTQIKQFRLNHNRLKSVSADLGQMTNLYELWLDSNELTALPPEIGNLEKTLQRLDVSHNALETLPDGFGRLAKLLVILLNDNRIKVLPRSIVALKPNGVVLGNNRLCEVPDTIRTWIDKYVIAFNGFEKNWMESQRLDDEHNCDGTLGIFPERHTGRDSRYSIEVSTGRIVLTGSANFSCSLFDLNGVKVFQSHHPSKRSEFGFPMEKSGVYFVHFESANGIYTQKLVVP